jgi:hydroxymethylbilane synthase
MTQSTTSTTLRLGARGSLLSRMQSQLVADALERRHPGLHVELCIYKTTGDVMADRPLHEAGGKGLFTKELELALLNDEVDFAVHSFKDVPVTMPLVKPADLVIAAVPPREDWRDVLVCARWRTIADLPQHARVGTGSLRRRCQVLAARPDLQVESIRGNVDTRLRKCREGEFDAVILAMAGLRRAALFDDADMTPIDTSVLLPAAAQGALAIQCRRDDSRTRPLLAVLNDPTTFACVALERKLVMKLVGDCHSPIAALAQIQGDTIEFRAVVGARDGNPPVVHAEASAPLAHPDQALAAVYDSLASQRVHDLLGTSA